MPQTLASWDAMLKEFYEPNTISQIENKTRILKSFGESDAPTVDGRRVVYPLHIGRNTGVQSSPEGGRLPDAGRQNHVDVHIPLRKTVGRINITKDVIDASRSNRGSFKRAMATEQGGLVRDISDYRNEMLCGYGTGQVATVLATGSSGTTHTGLTFDTPGGFTGTVNANRFIQEGQVYSLIRAGAIVAGTLTCTAVTQSGAYDTADFTSAATLTPTADDILVRHAVSSATPAIGDSDWQQPIMGLFGLVDDGTYVNTLHGINRTTYPVFRSFVLSAVGALSLDALQRAFDAAEMKGQGNITEMWCDHGTRRAYLTLLESDRRYTSEKLMNTDGGTKAVKGSDVMFGGVPFKTERDFPYGFVVGADTETMQRYVNVRGQWEDEDGRILDRSANTHDFTALWYMKDNFHIERPNSCFRMDGITTTQLAIHID